MTKSAVNPADVVDTLKQLHNEGLEHLRVRSRGAALVIESGLSDDPVLHARLVRQTENRWALHIADHRGRWEPTGLLSRREDLVDTLVNDFGWVLTDIDPDDPS